MNKMALPKHIMLISIGFFATSLLLGTSELSQSNTQSTQDNQLVAISLPQESKIRRSRMRKTTGKKKKKKTTLSTMNYEELAIAKNRQVAANNKDIAIKYVEQMMKLCDDINKLAEHLVELGDLLFDCSQFERSAHIYIEFTNLYPGNDQVEYSLYRGILSSFYCTLDAEHDQTKTEETIALTDKFLEREDVFVEYRNEVKKIRTQCYHKLVQSEFLICNFYINRGGKKSLKAAELRIEDLRTAWLKKLPEIEPQIIAFEAQLAEKKKDTKTAQEKKQELEHMFSETTKIAQNKKTRSMIDRF